MTNDTPLIMKMGKRGSVHVADSVTFREKKKHYEAVHYDLFFFRFIFYISSLFSSNIKAVNGWVATHRFDYTWIPFPPFLFIVKIILATCCC